MEIILTSTDLVDIIKSSFTGVKDVKFNSRKLKAILEVDPEKFIQFRVRTGTIVKPNELSTVVVNPEGKSKEEVEKGLMSSGGTNRNMIHIG